MSRIRKKTDFANFRPLVPLSNSHGFTLDEFFFSFWTFLAGQQSKLKEKLENSALNRFLVVNEPEEQEFSLKKLKFQQILRSGWRLHGMEN
jgi:hypothetical protein